MRAEATTIEAWRPVVGWEGLYEVSDLGRVRSLDRMVDRGGGAKLQSGRMLKLRSDSVGYLQVGLRTGGQGRVYRVHRLVLEAFSGPRVARVARHINGDPLDNRAVNLAWGTQAENMADRVAHGTVNHGARNGMAKLTEAQVREIRAVHAVGGASLRQIGEMFGVRAEAVFKIVHRKKWAHLDPV